MCVYVLLHMMRSTSRRALGEAEVGAGVKKSYSTRSSSSCGRGGGGGSGIEGGGVVVVLAAPLLLQPTALDATSSTQTAQRSPPRPFVRIATRANHEL